MARAPNSPSSAFQWEVDTSSEEGCSSDKLDPVPDAFIAQDRVVDFKLGTTL